MTQLPGWQNFYVIVGSSAGALIGLQFVVITLVSSMPRVAGMEQAGGAYATPTIVHFSTVLLLAAALCAPWPSIGVVGIFLALVGLAGLIYTCIVTRRQHKQTAYTPVFEDWLFHSLLPAAAYVVLAVAPWLAAWRPDQALFAVGATALLLLFAGIHNAWDAVTYHVFTQKPESGPSQAKPSD